MRRLHVFSFGLSIILLTISSSSILAQSPTDRIQQRQENREQAVEAQQERVEERTQARQELRENIAQRHAARLRLRFDGYYDRLNQLLAKVRSRFEVLAQNGKNVTEATAKLNQAEERLEQARQYADESVKQFESIVPEEYQSQRQLALAGADMAQQTREQFKLSLQLMKEVVQLVKPEAE